MDPHQIYIPPRSGPRHIYKIKSNRISSGYYLTDDGRTHVYRTGRQWTVARVDHGRVWHTTVYASLRAAKKHV